MHTVSMQIIFMVEEQPYSNRQIERFFDDQLKEIKSHIDLKIDPVYAQTLKTNGRMTKAEEDLTRYKIWRGWMTGGMGIVMIILPIAVTLIAWMALRIVNIDNTVRAAVDDALTNRVQQIEISK